MRNDTPMKEAHASHPSVQAALDALVVEVAGVVERCRQVERASSSLLATDALVAARLLAAKVAILIESEGGGHEHRGGDNGRR